MNNLSGGYIMVDLSSPNKVKQLEKAAALNKPLLVYYQDGTTEWGKVAVTYETIDDEEIPTYHITTANGFITVEADGDVSGRPLIAEGDGEGLQQTGVTISYCKWSLTGTHLMCVVAGTIANTTVLTNGTNLATFSVPSYIWDKIYPVWNENIEAKSVDMYASDWTKQSPFVAFKKGVAKLIIQNGTTTTFTADRNFRIQFDLLIDNE